MKKLYVAFILVLLFNITQAQTTWKVLSEPRTSNEFKASSFINDNEGWVIDDKSILWHTNDGCETLDTLSIGKYFLKLDFVDALVGYAIDFSYVYKTTDGGLTWLTLTMPGSIKDVLYFLNSDTGFVSGENKYYRTTDGGASWANISMNDVSFCYFNDYFFVNDSTGFATAENADSLVYKTTDCGLSWSGILYTNSYFNAVWFANKDTGYIAGYHDFDQGPEIWKTTDGGLTWDNNYYSSGDNGVTLKDIRFNKDLKHGYAISDWYDDALTNDGEVSWIDLGYLDWYFGLPIYSYPTYNALDGFDDLYMIGDFGSLLKWNKDAAIWSDASGRIVSDIIDLSSTSASSVYMASGVGILKTADGGISWNKIPGPIENLRTINAVTDSLIIAIAPGLDFPEIVFRSADGGQSWNSTSFYKNFEEFNLQMIDENTGYFSCLSIGYPNPDTTLLWKTTDGGLTWLRNAIAVGVNDNDCSMYFLNEYEGWKTLKTFDNKALLYHTSDGGSTWSLIYQSANNSYQLQEIFFLNSLHGYFGTTGSNYFETTNGGITWSPKSIPGATNYLKIFFADAQNGWCLTKTDVYETTDGGTTWSNSYHSSTDLYDFEYSQGSIFVRGFYGFLLKGISPAICNAYFTLVPDSIIEGLYYGYNLSSGYDLTYSWDWGDGTTTVGQFPSHAYADSGWYNICLSIYDNYNGCTDTFCLNFYILKTDGEMGIHQIIFIDGAVPTPPIKTNEAVEINISPNPFTETTAIEISLSQASEMKIELFDLKGRIIRTVADENFTEGKNEINFKKESLAAGIYFLQLKTQTETITKKLVVE